jgi:predicted DNA-binding protein (MmcQ/YjbR family)
MDIEQLRNYALSKPNTEESFPFGDDTLVFKVNGKIFLLTGLDNQPLQFNVKCNPDKAIELREAFPDAVLPGYHMNKTLEHHCCKWTTQQSTIKRNGG